MRGIGGAIPPEIWCDLPLFYAFLPVLHQRTLTKRYMGGLSIGTSPDRLSARMCIVKGKYLTLISAFDYFF